MRKLTAILMRHIVASKNGAQAVEMAMAETVAGIAISEEGTRTLFKRQTG
jgi:hypothetical protein